jgi:hypothetical protein
MESSRSLAGKGTTMVLPADSPLFGVLFDSNYFNGNAAEHNGGIRGEASSIQEKVVKPRTEDERIFH